MGTQIIGESGKICSQTKGRIVPELRHLKKKTAQSAKFHIEKLLYCGWLGFIFLIFFRLNLLGLHELGLHELGFHLSGL